MPSRTSAISAIGVLTVLLVLIAAPLTLRAQLIINQGQNPTTLVHNVLLGPGVFASNIQFNGRPGTQMAITDSIWGEVGRFNGTYTHLGLSCGISFVPTKLRYIYLAPMIP